MFFGTTNPDSPNHWLKKDWLDRAGDLDLKRFQLQLDDNPNLPPEYVEAVKKEHTGLWYRRFVLGEWTIAEGAIYDGWDPVKHQVARIPELERKWLGIDYGTSNPFVALLFGLGVDGRVYVVSEWRYDGRAKRQMTDGEYSREVKAWLERGGHEPEWAYVDPSAASFITQLWHDGFPGVRDADNAVADGIRVVARALAQDRLKVHESCVELIAEIPSYVWDSVAQERGEDRPLKANDHSVDALRYGLASSEFMWANEELDADKKAA